MPHWLALDIAPHFLGLRIMAISKSTLDALGIFVSGYAKRLLESQYDGFAKTDFGQRLRGLDSRLKYGIEAALYAAMAYANHRLPEETPIQILLKEVAMDLPSELSKRIINGDIPEGGASPSSAVSAHAPSPLSELDDESLRNLARWLSEMTQEERVRALAALAKPSAEPASQPHHREPAPEPGSSAVESGLKHGSLLASATARMEQARAALQAKKLAMKDKRKGQ